MRQGSVAWKAIQVQESPVVSSDIVGDGLPIKDDFLLSLF